MVKTRKSAVETIGDHSDDELEIVRRRSVRLLAPMNVLRVFSLCDTVFIRFLTDLCGSRAARVERTRLKRKQAQKPKKQMRMK